jgi:rod shape-determining protein MreD
MKRLQALLLLAGVVLLLRSTALTPLAARGIVVDALAFATVLWALRHDAAWGATFGFLLGLAADLDAVRGLGRHALALSLIGYGIGRLSRTLVRDSIRTQYVLLLLATVVHQTWTVAFEVGSMAAWPYLAGRVLLAALITPVLGVVFLYGLRAMLGRPVFGHANLESDPAI